MMGISVRNPSLKAINSSSVVHRVVSIWNFDAHVNRHSAKVSYFRPGSCFVYACCIWIPIAAEVCITPWLHWWSVGLQDHPPVLWLHQISPILQNCMFVCGPGVGCKSDTLVNCICYDWLIRLIKKVQLPENLPIFPWCIMHRPSMSLWRILLDRAGTSLGFAHELKPSAVSIFLMSNGCDSLML